MLPQIENLSLLVAHGHSDRHGGPDSPKRPIGLHHVGDLEVRNRRWIRPVDRSTRPVDPATMKVFLAAYSIIAMMWPLSVWAAAVSTTIESDKWWWSLGMATLGTLTAVLSRIHGQIEELRNEDPATPPKKKPLTTLGWAVLVASQMSFCWLAGAMFYLMGLHWGLPQYVLPVTVAAACIGGAKSVEWLMNKVLQK